MGSAILQLASDVADAPEINLTRPLSLFSAANEGDTSDRKLLRSLTRTIRTLAATWDWQVLRRERLFTTLAQETQTAMVPVDFLRFIPDTMWDRTSRWRLNGPLPPQDWAAVKAWQTGGMVPSYCQRGDDILTFPSPSAGRTLAFEYISTAIGRSHPTAPSVSADITRFSADTDTTFWDDELIILGAIAFYRQGERFDYAEDQAAFQALMANRIKQDGGRRTINMGGQGALSADQRLNDMRSAAIVISR